MAKLRQPRIWRYLKEYILTRKLVAVLFVAGLALSWVLVRANQFTHPVFARVKPPPISGTTGVASVRATASFDDLSALPTNGEGAMPQSIPSMPDTEPLPLQPESAPVHLDGEAEEAAQPWENRAPDSPTPSASFLALADNNTHIPPNTMGAAGPNHLMVTLNSEVRIQDKTGTNLSTTSLQSFWAPVGPYTTTTGVFGPRLNYDPYGNRWIAAASAEPMTSNSSVLVAVSQTNDPTGAWNFYRVDVDASDLLWADAPNIGFNKDWIVVEVNLFRISDGISIRSDIFVFDKADLYAGGAGTYTLLTLSGQGETHVPAATYDDTLATIYLIKNWSGDNGTIGIWAITQDTGVEINFEGYVSTGDLWENASTAGLMDLAPQLGDPRKIANGDARIQNVVYRNGSLWTTHTVFLPSNGGAGTIATRSLIQWWEIDPVSVSVNQFGRIDDPTGNIFYAFPSIAVNQFNDFLIGYSRFSATQYASANYAYHDHTDAPNSLQTDTVLKAGEAKYDKEDGNLVNRWGDYSQTVVDPANDTDFWTIQQYAALPSGGFDRWGTWWGKIGPQADPTETPTPVPTATSTPTPTNTPDPSITLTPTNTPGPLQPESYIPMVYKEYVP